MEELQKKYFTSERWDVLFYGNIENKKTVEVWDKFFKTEIPEHSSKPEIPE